MGKEKGSILKELLFSTVLTVALFSFITANIALAGSLSCSITTSAACVSPSVIVLRMSAATNAHAELPSQSTAGYASNVVCCTGVTGLGNSCSGIYATVGHLSAVTNAHFEQNIFSNFANNVCISVATGNVSIGYQATNCTGYDTTLASTPATNNTHVGSPANYTNKICGTAAPASLTFTVDYSPFPAAAPGIAAFATTTLSVTTNHAHGWNVTLSGDNKNSTNNNLQRTGDTTVQIPDQIEWVPGAATTTAGNAVRMASLINSTNVLAFRVMSASSTNSTAFLSPAWWGTTDAYVDSATSFWAGIASSTAANLQIGNSSVPSNTAALNTVVYYLKTTIAQKTGSYTAPITYTATINP